MSGRVLLAAVVASLCARASADTVIVERPAIVWIGDGEVHRGESEREALELARSCRAEAPLVEAQACVLAFVEARVQRPLRVFVPAFGIDRHEVTVAAYLECVRRGACEVPRGASPTDARVPITSVSARDAETYCAFAGGRLPTDAEWTRAARAGSQRVYPWGDAFNPSLVNHGRLRLRDGRGRLGADAIAVPSDVDGFVGLAPVGAFPDGASPFGVVDLAGNVAEWTRDGVVAPTATVEDELRVAGGAAIGAARRVVRGGSFRSPRFGVRVRAFEVLAEDASRDDVGFRCAYDVAHGDVLNSMTVGDHGRILRALPRSPTP